MIFTIYEISYNLHEKYILLKIAYLELIIYNRNDYDLTFMNIFANR